MTGANVERRWGSVEAGMGAQQGRGGCQLEAHPSERRRRGPEPGSLGHTPISFLVQGERGVPGRKGVKGQKGEPGPPGLDQPCPVVRVGAEWEPQPRSLPPQARVRPTSSLSSELTRRPQRPPQLSLPSWRHLSHSGPDSPP